MYKARGYGKCKLARGVGAKFAGVYSGAEIRKAGKNRLYVEILFDLELLAGAFAHLDDRVSTGVQTFWFREIAF